MRYHMMRLLVVAGKYENRVVNTPGLKAVGVLLCTFSAYGFLRIALSLYHLAGRIRSWEA